MTSASPTTTSPGVDQIEAFIADLVAHLDPDPQEPKPGRPRILPSLALWGGLPVRVLRGLPSQRALWRLLSHQGLWFYPQFPVTDQAVYNRLDTADPSPLETLFTQVRDALAPRLAPYADDDLAPFAGGGYALDQTTLDPVLRRLPTLRGLPAGADALLPGRLDGLFDVRRQQWVRLQLTDNPHQNEKVAARSLIADLPADSLILADLGYFGFPWFDELTDAGYCWLSRQRAAISSEVIHTFYEAGETRDVLIWLGAYRSDRAKYAVRLVQFRQGGTLYRYITNVLDPTVFTIQQIAQTYARRWDIEMAVQLVKQHLGLRLFWSAKPSVLRHQLWAVLIIAQILQALRLEIAGRAGVDPFEVSLPLLVEYAPRLAADGIDPVVFFVERGRQAGFIRPSRRTVIHAPAIPPHLVIPRPPDLILQRVPRYAGKIGREDRRDRNRRR